jgi:hypothetical protein
VTPTLSEAVALKVIVPLTVLPLAGAVRETLGGVVSALLLLTVAVTTAETVEFPAASYALAVKLCDPLAIVAVLQDTL